MGNFAVLPLLDLVEYLARRQQTGALTCERGTVRKTLYLREGRAVGAASNDPREYLGQLLVNFGHITDDDLAKAFKTQEETKVRLGKVLTMVGVVKPEVIKDVLAIKIRETLLDVFLWDSGMFSLDDTPPPPVDELDAVIALGDILREAEFRATAWSAFRGEFSTGAAALEVDETKVPAGLAPQTIDGRMLALAREGKTIDEIGLALHATDFHLYQRLYSLARQGIVRASPARHSGRAPGQAGMDSAELVERARGLVADGRADDAELAATGALALAPDSVAAREVLAEAERLLSQQLRADLLEPGRVARRLVDAGAIAGLKLSNVDKYLLSRCDGQRTVRQLAHMVPLRELDVLKALRRLADGGVVELS